MELNDTAPMEEHAPDDQMQGWTAGLQQEESMDGPADPSGQHPPVDLNGHPADEHSDAQNGSMSAIGEGAPENSPQKSQSGGHGRGYKPREPKPNKVYIGGLPENTRQEDLQNCFGKLGNVVNIELKLGYGFVEFDSVKAAEEAVAKYNEGFFMGNKIKVEQSHGGGRTSKYSNDPGACFKCGQHGHWARECPNPAVPGAGHGGNKKYQQHNGQAAAGQEPLIDRIAHPPRDYVPPPPPRDYPPYRDEYRDRERYPPPPPPPRGDDRYGYARPPPPREARDFRDPRDIRIPPSPPRDYRDYPAGPPRREYDDYRRADARGGPPALPPPSSRYGSYYPEPAPYGPTAPGYTPRSDYPPPPPPPPRDAYARPYERRDSGPVPPLPPPGDKYAYAGPPPVGRARSPGPPSRTGREEYDRAAPPRDYARPADYRTRSPLPTNGGRYADYPARDAAYRRRSPSPPRSAASGSYRGFPDPKVSGAAPYPPTNGYSENGYSAPPSGGPGGPPSGRTASLSNGRERDFAPRGNVAGESAGYVRRA